MKKPLDLVKRNEGFVERIEEIDPHYFEELSRGQQPSCFVLSCSDSRVSPSIVTQAPLGSMFVHRNIANQVVSGDPSFEAGLAYALGQLGIRKVLVLGHTGCGGIAAACAMPTGSVEGGVLGEWLGHVRQSLGAALAAPGAGSEELARANVLEQMAKLRSHPVVKAYGAAVEGYLLQLESGRLEAVAGGKR